MESAIGGLRPRKKIPYNPQQVENVEVPERRVLRILSRLKQQNYGEGPVSGLDWQADPCLCGQVPLDGAHGLTVWEPVSNRAGSHQTPSSTLWTLPSSLSPMPRLSLRYCLRAPVSSASRSFVGMFNIGPTCRNENPREYADKGQSALQSIPKLCACPFSWASFSLSYGQPHTQPSALSIIPVIVYSVQWVPISSST